VAGTCTPFPAWLHACASCPSLLRARHATHCHRLAFLLALSGRYNPAPADALRCFRPYRQFEHEPDRVNDPSKRENGRKYLFFVEPELIPVPISGSLSRLSRMGPCTVSNLVLFGTLPHQHRRRDTAVLGLFGLRHAETHRTASGPLRKAQSIIHCRVRGFAESLHTAIRPRPSTPRSADPSMIESIPVIG